MDVISNFAARFERSREEELSLEEYLAECKRNPLAYATAAERMLKAIGEPQIDRHAQRPAHVAPLRQQGHQDLSRVRRVLRHGGRDRAGRLATSATPRRGWRKRSRSSICWARSAAARSLDRRAAEAADGARAVLRDQGLAGERVAARPVRPDEDGPILENEYGIPRRYLNRILSPWAVKRLRRVRRRHPQVPVVKRYPSILQADRHLPRPSRATRTTRTSRRWSARSTSASSRPTPRTTRTPTATPAACAWPTRACSSSSKCSRRRSRCCTRC